MELNKKIVLSGLLFVIGGQTVAFLIYFFFKESSFQVLFIASLVGFFASSNLLKSKS
jgi:hypothetical protein